MDRNEGFLSFALFFFGYGNGNVNGHVSVSVWWDDNIYRWEGCVLYARTRAE